MAVQQATQQAQHIQQAQQPQQAAKIDPRAKAVGRCQIRMVW